MCRGFQWLGRGGGRLLAFLRGGLGKLPLTDARCDNTGREGNETVAQAQDRRAMKLGH